MHSINYNFKQLLVEFDKAGERTVTAQRLVCLLGKSLSYKEVIELLCDYIKAARLYEISSELEALGDALVTQRRLEAEIESLNERYITAQNQISAAETMRYQALNREAALKLENIGLQEKLRLLRSKLNLEETSGAANIAAGINNVKTAEEEVD